MAHHRTDRTVAKALRLAPDDPASLYSYACIRRTTDERDLAVRALRRAVALQPTNDDVRRLLGIMLSEQGEVDAGIAELKEAVRLRPNYWRNLQTLGVQQYEAGRFADARVLFQRVWELQPDTTDGPYNVGAAEYADAYSGIGTVYFDAGRCADAKAAFEKAIQLRPDPAHHRDLGDLYAFMGERSPARAEWERAAARTEKELVLTPSSAPHLATLGIMRAKLGARNQALELAGRAAALAPTNAEVLHSVAVVHALLGDRATAAEWLERAFRAGYSPARAARDLDLAGVAGAATQLPKGGPFMSRTFVAGAAALVLAPLLAQAASSTCPGPHREIDCRGDESKPRTCTIEVRVEEAQVCQTNGDLVAVNDGDTIVWRISRATPDDKRKVSIEKFRQLVDNTAEPAKVPLSKQPCSVTQKSDDRFECVVTLKPKRDDPESLFLYNIVGRGGSAGLIDVVAGVKPKQGKGP